MILEHRCLRQAIFPHNGSYQRIHQLLAFRDRAAVDAKFRRQPTLIDRIQVRIQKVTDALFDDLQAGHVLCDPDNGAL